MLVHPAELTSSIIVLWSKNRSEILIQKNPYKEWTLFVPVSSLPLLCICPWPAQEGTARSLCRGVQLLQAAVSFFQMNLPLDKYHTPPGARLGSVKAKQHMRHLEKSLK